MKEILEELGLSKNEAVVYLTLSEIGLSSAYKIAKESKIHKSNAYGTIEKLSERGLVMKKVLEGKTLYEAVDPSFLLDLLDTKKEKVANLIPSIRLLQKSSKKDTTFNVYKGPGALINLLFRDLEFNEPILVYGAPKIAHTLLGKRLDEFHKERIKRKIKMYHIYNFEAGERVKKLKRLPYTPIKNLPELFDSDVATHICGDEVVFGIWVPPVKFIQIKDKDMAKAYKNYFKILWKAAKPFK